MDVRVKFTNAHKFVFSIKSSDPLPPSIMKVGSIGYSTLDLMKLNERIRESMDEIVMISARYSCMGQLLKR